jgi:hypothetical protein
VSRSCRAGCTTTYPYKRRLRTLLFFDFPFSVLVRVLVASLWTCLLNWCPSWMYRTLWLSI